MASVKLSATTYFFLGLAMLMPWNAIISSFDFFFKVFPTEQPSFVFLLFYSFPMLIVQMASFFTLY